LLDLITTVGLIRRAVLLPNRDLTRRINRTTSSYLRYTTRAMVFSPARLLLLSSILLLNGPSRATAFTSSSSTRLRSALSSSSVLNMVADNAKVILVTGSSRGLGKSIALDLGQHGQKVVINYVSDGSKAAAEATVSEVKALGGDAIAVQCDSTFCLLRVSVCVVGRRSPLLYCPRLCIAFFLPETMFGVPHTTYSL
jgi:hypothetical protein